MRRWCATRRHTSSTHPESGRPTRRMPPSSWATRFSSNSTARAGASGSRLRSDSTRPDRKSTRLNSSHSQISYAVFCLKKKKEDPLASSGLATGIAGHGAVRAPLHGRPRCVVPERLGCFDRRPPRVQHRARSGGPLHARRCATGRLTCLQRSSPRSSSDDAYLHNPPEEYNVSAVARLPPQTAFVRLPKRRYPHQVLFFFFNNRAPPEISSFPIHAAIPI